MVDSALFYTNYKLGHANDNDKVYSQNKTPEGVW